MTKILWKIACNFSLCGYNRERGDAAEAALATEKEAKEIVEKHILNPNKGKTDES